MCQPSLEDKLLTQLWLSKQYYVDVHTYDVYILGSPK